MTHPQETMRAVFAEITALMGQLKEPTLSNIRAEFVDPLGFNDLVSLMPQQEHDPLCYMPLWRYMVEVCLPPLSLLCLTRDTFPGLTVVGEVKCVGHSFP